MADRLGLTIPLAIGTLVCAPVLLGFLLTSEVTAVFAVFFFWGLARSWIFGPGRGYLAANAPPHKKATLLAIFSATMSASRSFGALPGGIIADNWGYQVVVFLSSGIILAAGVVVVVGLRNVRLAEPGTSFRPIASVPSPVSPANVSPGEDRLNYRPVLIQFAVANFYFFGLGVVMAFLPLLATQVVGLSATEVGALFTIRGLAAMSLGIPMGMLADRRGKRMFLIIGPLVASAGLAGIAWAGSFEGLLVSMVANGLGMAVFGPAAIAWLSDNVPRRMQGTVMGLYGAVGENTGVMAGQSLGGVLWVTAGPQMPFVIGSIVTGLAAAICLCGLTKGTATSSPRAGALQ